MLTIEKPWRSSAQTLEDSWIRRLATELAPTIDPTAQDPALIFHAADMEPDDWQADLLRSDWDRALLLCSRQAGKSTVTGALATHVAIYQPGSLILLLAAALRQSQELFRKVRTFYHAIGRPVPVLRESALQMELVNGSRIIALPGQESTIRSYSGVDLLVIDEASRVDDSLYYSVRPMLAVSGGRLICLSTPFGRRGFFFSEWTEGGPDWHRTKITAYDCLRITDEFLEEERRALGDWWFRQEYLCEFVEGNEQVFTHDLVLAAVSGDVEPLFE